MDGWRDGQRDGQKKGRMEGHKFYRTLEPFVGPFRLLPQVQKSNKYSASKTKITLIILKYSYCKENFIRIKTFYFSTK